MYFLPELWFWRWLPGPTGALHQLIPSARRAKPRSRFRKKIIGDNSVFLIERQEADACRYNFAGDAISRIPSKLDTPGKVWIAHSLS
jgi:hypothetical protein